MKIHRVLFVAAACLVATGAHAQTLKPGLWEVTNKMHSASGEMEKAQAQMRQQMASMPPEQRKMFEEMMAKQGVKMSPGGMNVRMCLTPDMAKRDEFPAQQGDCKTTLQQRAGNTIKMAYTCANPPSSGEGQYTIVSPEAYTMKMVMRSTVKGKSETMNMDAAGKWLSADCGSVKPVRPPGAK